MKIALVAPYDYSYPGGVRDHIIHLAGEFRNLNHEVRILTPASGDDSAVRQGDIYQFGSVAAIPANGSVARITLSLRLSHRVKEILRDEAFDVVHLHEPLIPGVPITVLRFSRALNIGTFHAFGKTNYAYFYGRSVLQRYVAKLDGRIAVSEPAKEFVSQYFPGDYSIIPNGISLERFNAKVEPVPELADGRPNLVFVGRMEKRKGLGYLLRAMPHIVENFPDARLVVVGDGPLREGYEAYVAAHDLTENVIFTGYVPAEMLPRYYASADVFVAPSTGGESFGIILLEAMACGRPIVASRIAGYSSVVTHNGEGLLVAPKDPYALTNAVCELLEHPKLAQAMGERGRLTAVRYAWPRVAAEVLAFYRECQERSGADVRSESRPSIYRRVVQGVFDV